MWSCSGSHWQGWAPLRLPLHVSKALPGHPKGERQHVSGRILALRDQEALSNRTMWRRFEGTLRCQYFTCPALMAVDVQLLWKKPVKQAPYSIIFSISLFFHQHCDFWNPGPWFGMPGMAAQPQPWECK